MAEAPLRFSGEVSIFTGDLTTPEAGTYMLQVLASQPGTRNFGRHEVPVTVGE